MSVDLVRVYREIRGFDSEPDQVAAALFAVEPAEYDRLIIEALPSVLTGFLDAAAAHGAAPDIEMLVCFAFTIGLTVGGAAAREAVTGG